MIYQDEVHGPLLEQIDSALDILIKKYLKARISYDGIYRIESLPIPLEALREALLNAITHKDYSSGIPIQISVYENKLMIWNNGQLYDGWTVDNLLKKHPSRPFNPYVADVFFRAGLIETWGRGIEKMFDACKNQKIPEPLVSFENAGLWVTFSFSKELPEQNEGINEGISEGINEGLDETDVKILKHIIADPYITSKAIALKTGKSQSTIERRIKKLKNSHIKRIGSRKSGYWKLLPEIQLKNKG